MLLPDRWRLITHSTVHNNPNPTNSNGPTITGTYTTNGNPVYSNGSGTFVATWFLDFSAKPQTYLGGLAGPDSGSVDVPTMITLGTDKTSHELIGTVTVPGWRITASSASLER